MTIGLGSVSTVNWMLKKLGKKVSQGLNIRVIPSSRKTEKLLFGVVETGLFINMADKIIIGNDVGVEYLD